MEEMSEQGLFNFRSESTHFRSTNISQPNMCTVVTDSVRTNVDSHYFLYDYENGMLHRMTQFDGVQHQPILNVDVPASSSLAVSLNPYFNVYAASSSIAPPNARHNEIVIPLLPHYGSLGSVMLRDSNCLIQRNYLGDQHLLSHRFPHLQYHVFYYQTQLVQEVRCHSINFQAPSYRVPANPPSSSSMSIQNATFGSLYMLQPPPHRGNMHGTAPGHWRNLPSVAFLQDDDVPSLGDHHSDLDIEDMSYEEVLVLDELDEQIGNVGMGLLEEIIAREMKIKTCLLPNDLDGATSEEQETDLCIICQDEYKNKEELGILKCGHRYHADCIRRWLHEKNVCPMCKLKVLDLA